MTRETKVFELSTSALPDGTADPTITVNALIDGLYPTFKPLVHGDIAIFIFKNTLSTSIDSFPETNCICQYNVATAKWDFIDRDNESIPLGTQKYIDNVLLANSTPSRKVHISELRNVASNLIKNYIRQHGDQLFGTFDVTQAIMKWYSNNNTKGRGANSFRLYLENNSERLINEIHTGTTNGEWLWIRRASGANGAYNPATDKKFSIGINRLVSYKTLFIGLHDDAVYDNVDLNVSGNATIHDTLYVEDNVELNKDLGTGLETPGSWTKIWGMTSIYNILDVDRNVILNKGWTEGSAEYTTLIKGITTFWQQALFQKTGVSPFQVVSNIKVLNLNADLLDGWTSNFFVVDIIAGAAAGLTDDKLVVKRPSSTADYPNYANEVTITINNVENANKVDQHHANEFVANITSANDQITFTRTDGAAGASMTINNTQYAHNAGNSDTLDTWHLQDILNEMPVGVADAGYFEPSYAGIARSGRYLSVNLPGVGVHFIAAAVGGEGLCHSQCHSNCHNNCHSWHMCYTSFDSKFLEINKGLFNVEDDIYE